MRSDSPRRRTRGTGVYGRSLPSFESSRRCPPCCLVPDARACGSAPVAPAGGSRPSEIGPECSGPVPGASTTLCATAHDGCTMTCPARHLVVPTADRATTQQPSARQHGRAIVNRPGTAGRFAALGRCREGLSRQPRLVVLASTGVGELEFLVPTVARVHLHLERFALGRVGELHLHLPMALLIGLG